MLTSLRKWPVTRVRPITVRTYVMALLVLLGLNVRAQWTKATLSEGRSELSSASAGGKAFFAGGSYSQAIGDYSDIVDIYTMASNAWSLDRLSQGRSDLAATSAGSKVFFGGGYWKGPQTGADASNVVDIYDTATGKWSTASLSQARFGLSATSAGGKVFFAGGNPGVAIGEIQASDVVDIYDTATDKWSTANLSQARLDLSTASAGGKVFFAGGSTSKALSTVVDIYDTATGKWSTANLSQARFGLSATSSGTKVIFAGGATNTDLSDVVDIYDTATDSWSTAKLSQARYDLVATSAGGLVFFAGGDTDSNSNDYVVKGSDVVDIFDVAANIWSTSKLSQARVDLGATSVGNKAIFAGGYTQDKDASGLHVHFWNTVDIYTTQLTTTPPAESLALLAPTYNCSTGAIHFNTKGGDGSIIEYMAAGITQWSTSPDHVLDYDSRTANDVQPFTLTARQSGKVVTYTWDRKTALCSLTPPIGQALSLITPTYNCSTGAIHFNTQGGDGSAIEYMAAGITQWSTSSDHILDYDSRTANDVQPFTLMARQSGYVVTYKWDRKTACGQARIGLTYEAGTGLSLTVLGNPVVGERVELEVRGAADQTLNWQSLNSQGRILSQDQTERASGLERRWLSVAGPMGVYLLKVSTSDQQKIIKVVRQ